MPMFDAPIITIARSTKSLLQILRAESLISLARTFYYSVLLRDTGKNFIRKRLNGEVYKFVPALARSADSYETHIVDWLKQFLKAGDTFWDIGANWGWISLPAARIVGSSGQVIAIEPSPSNLAWLKRHIALNGCETIVRVIEAAVCEQNGGVINFSLLDDGCSPSNSLMFSNSVNGEAPKVSREISVPAITLDSLFEQKRVPQLVKIDVEGAELKVLKGATQLLKSETAPILLLAVHPFWQATPEDCQEIVNILKEAGYQILNSQGASVEALEYDEYLCLPPKS